MEPERSAPADEAMEEEPRAAAETDAAGPSSGPSGPQLFRPPSPPGMHTLAVAEDGVLDLTGAQLHSLDGVDLPDSLTDLDLTCSRLKSIDPRVLALAGLTSLSYRQNLLTDASALSGLKSAPVLKQLVLHDNHLTKVPALGMFSSLSRLELSYNQLRSLKPLEELAEAPLTDLFAASNKVTSFDGLAPLTKLRVLELGRNRLKRVEHMDSAKELRELWLGSNRIDTLQGFPTLLNLTIVALPSNRLTSMRGLESCKGLEEIYLSHNGILKIEGLEPLTNLRILDVATNAIERVEGLETLTRLTDLWLNDNKIPTLEGLKEALASQLQTLTCIYLENNPGAKTPGYKAAMLGMLPKLEQLDANDIVH